ncbi:hypothetical protein Patl1_33423 [Pistacia atlantica]|uniref:Uncharacterized protein n=1 Tax=Pistacia atlantica TaxID=434234 RepID=A0ACC0ZVF1_9ROSI|nr:hypothetical protein Patl1_33423 [Pistacia atlantica]
MWHSKMHLQYAMENDPIMQEIKNILQHGESDEEWTLFFQGSTMATVESEIILRCLRDFDLWRRYINGKDFVTTPDSYLANCHLYELLYSLDVDIPFWKIDTLLSYDKSNRGWAVFWNESAMATYFKHGVMSDEELFMSRMPRYSVYDPSLFDPAVIMYIQEVWQFKEPILIVLDPQGKEGGKTLVTRDLAN